MKPKTRAALGVLLTIAFGLIGASAYSSGYMTFFGFRLAPSVFFGLIVVWLVVGIINLMNVSKAEDRIEEEAVIAEAHLEELPSIEVPCQVSITRLRSALGAAMGVRVFLNGVAVGILKSGTTLEFTTPYASNVLKLVYDADMSEKSVDFAAESGGRVRITLKYSGAVLTVEPDTAAGWHPDPGSRHQLRYWNGAKWTEHVSDDGVQSQDPL